MSDDPDLTKIAVELEPGQTVAHVITLIVTTTMEDFEESTRVVMTPHTPRIHAMGIVADAMEQLKDAASAPPHNNPTATPNLPCDRSNGARTWKPRPVYDSFRTRG